MSLNSWAGLTRLVMLSILLGMVSGCHVKEKERESEPKTTIDDQSPRPPVPPPPPQPEKSQPETIVPILLGKNRDEILKEWGEPQETKKVVAVPLGWIYNISDYYQCDVRFNVVYLDSMGGMVPAEKDQVQEVIISWKEMDWKMDHIPSRYGEKMPHFISGLKRARDFVPDHILSHPPAKVYGLRFSDIRYDNIVYQRLIAIWPLEKGHYLIGGFVKSNFWEERSVFNETKGCFENKYQLTTEKGEIDWADQRVMTIHQMKEEKYKVGIGSSNKIPL
jgi:hypothetical protein